MILHIIQARSTSTRLPNKIFEKIGNKTLLEWHLENTAVHVHETGDKRVIAIPYSDPKEKQIRKIATKYNVEVYNPSCNENDVLKRFVLSAYDNNPDWIVRTTADCMMDKHIFYKTVRMAVNNNMPVFNSYYEGSTVEVFKYSDLLRADSELDEYRDINPVIGICGRLAAYHSEKWLETKNHREHVTSYFKKGFKKESIDTKGELENARSKYARQMGK